MQESQAPEKYLNRLHVGTREGVLAGKRTETCMHQGSICGIGVYQRHLSRELPSIHQAMRRAWRREQPG